MRARILLPPVLVLLLTVSGAWAQTLRIYQIDVDQGDATLVVSPAGRTLLIDSGKNGHGSRLRAILQQAGVTRIDHFVATHYHEDHYGGIDELAQTVPIVNGHDRGDKAFLPASRLNSSTYKGYQTAIGNRAVPLTRGETIALDPDMTVTCLSAGGAVLGETNPPQPGQDENDMSISLLIQYGAFRYFIGGDIETPTETKIADGDLAMDVDVYQADHHGADNGSSQNLLDDLSPRVIIISNGDNATYRHPRKTTLARMAALTPRPTVFQTNKYLHTNDDGGNVADSLIADPETVDADGTILLTVDLAAGVYDVAYANRSMRFSVKQRLAATHIVIESVLPDPVGSDLDLEEVTLRNTGTAAVDLSNWVLHDRDGRVWTLTSLGTIGRGQTATIRRSGMPMSLNNGGDTVILLDQNTQERDRFEYTGSQPGVRIQTGHGNN